MIAEKTTILKRILTISIGMLLVLIAAAVLGISVGSAGGGFETVIRSIFGKTVVDSSLEDIIWRIRMPRVVLAALSGGAAIGTISGILIGLSQFPGVSVSSFIGSMMTLALLLMISSGRTILRKESLLLSGVMVNAFCSAVIMFLVSMTQDARIHNIIFWLMGDLSLAGFKQVILLAAIVIPGIAVIFWLSHVMNLLLLGQETAKSLGVNLKVVTVILLGTTSLMVSATVSQCGLLGFVGLVIPHLLRFVVGPDHRVLVPACVLGGGAYMIVCDVLARTLPRQGEMPAGVVTAIIGAPLFIFLLKKSVR